MMRVSLWCLVTSQVLALAPLRNVTDAYPQNPVGGKTVSGEERRAAPSPFGAYHGQLTGLRDPRAVAISPRGDVFVADTGNQRVRVFDSRGNALRAWGRAGLEEDQLLRPLGITLDASERVYIADAGVHRVKLFDRDGTFISSWGGRGEKPGQFLEPRGIVSAGDKIYVADTGNHRVQVFDPDGGFLAAWGKRGREEGAFDHPVAVAVDNQGQVYVVDAGNARVQKLTDAGQFLRAWGDWGPFPGLFARPTSIAFHNGSLFVSDSGNHRIQVFDTAGKRLYQWGRHAVKPHEGEGALHYPDAIAVAPDGAFAVVAESFEDRIQRFSHTDLATLEAQTTPPGASYRDVHYGPHSAVSGARMLIAEPDTDSVLVLNTTHQVPIRVSVVGGHGNALGSFVGPTALAFAHDGRTAFVSDLGNHRLQVFRLAPVPDGELRFMPRMARFSKALNFSELAERQGVGRQLAIEPTAMRVDPRGHLLILDGRRARVVEISPSFDIARTWGSYGTQAGELLMPADFALNREGDRIYIVDALTCTVQGFDADGRFLFRFGNRGEGPGEFLEPRGIAVTHDHRVYVTDMGGHRVSYFDARGRFLGEWGGPGVKAGEFHKPRGIAQLADKRLVVIDYGNHRGQLFTVDGEFRGVFGARIYVRAARQR